MDAHQCVSAASAALYTGTYANVSSIVYEVYALREPCPGGVSMAPRRHASFPLSYR